MGQYKGEFKEQAVRRLLPPNAQSVAQVSRDLGVSNVSLYNWRNQYRDRGNPVPADPSNPENWSGKNKLAIVIETAALNEEELSA
ncbi:transposase [Haliea sp. E1-2-M8]|uniref:transposase n=1 Tax=Haliea sp. E1-2-M8 TaxID=3064706 RepID=UPI0027163425|nr:transposase [Haliea sp. E1-2-M8]MDO8863778.1 transposase [Haliea sp. E1-2-M8]